MRESSYVVVDDGGLNVEDVKKRVFGIVVGGLEADGHIDIGPCVGESYRMSDVLGLETF